MRSRLRTRREVLAQIALAGVGTLISACSAAPGSVATPTERPAANSIAPATAPATSTNSGRPTFVVFGAPVEPNGFNPLLIGNGGTSEAWELLFEGLVVPDPKQARRPLASPRVGIHRRMA